MGQVLEMCVNDTKYEQAFKEYEDLLSANDYGVHCRVAPFQFKRENVTEEQLTYKPHLAMILLNACEHRLKNYDMAWREYIVCIERHKLAVCFCFIYTAVIVTLSYFISFILF